MVSEGARRMADAFHPKKKVVNFPTREANKPGDYPPNRAPRSDRSGGVVPLEASGPPRTLCLEQKDSASKVKAIEEQVTWSVA